MDKIQNESWTVSEQLTQMRNKKEWKNDGWIAKIVPAQNIAILLGATWLKFDLLEN